MFILWMHLNISFSLFYILITVEIMNVMKPDKHVSI